MRLSKKGDYALRAVIQLALSTDSPKPISYISDVSSIPKNFAGKILKELTNHGILQSFAGKHGGFKLARSAESISFREVIEAVEGPIILNHCLDESSECDRVAICNMYDTWVNAQMKIIQVLESVKISDIIDSNAADWDRGNIITVENEQLK
ncbi:MAG: Rrf2 family transcriptional regulator [candidate division Zixibacteria bacterium]|nr:Rrf2 family transcriptional regulator [candidate division Zixibacteria bacterium]